jgi:hypothetical protein
MIVRADCVCEHVWIAVLGSVKLFPNLEAALKGVFNRVLTTLRLHGNRIGAEGAKAIAEALKVNAVLTKLDIGINRMGDAGKKAVQDAVKDRSGFVLEL